MATFKVGQRVRIVLPESRYYGRQATVTKIKYGGNLMAAWPSVEIKATNVTIYRVELDDGTSRRLDHAFLGYLANELAPLTDPKAEQFIESLKRLAREPIPLTEKELSKVVVGRAVRTAGCAPRGEQA